MAVRYPIVFKVDKAGLKQGEKSLANFGKGVAKVAAAATAAVAGIAAVGVREFANFDAALNKSLAIMGDVSDALRTEMSDAARQVAKETKFSAEQAAEAYFFLASAGLDAQQSIAAMPQVAKFAQAGMFDMALATDLATDAQSALGLTVDDANQNLENLTRITDVFVKANTLANTSVEQLATALTTKAGTALKTVNKEVEEGAAVLAVFADQGIKGERAGTLLTNTIFGLTDIMKKAPDEAEALGLTIFDAAGEMRSFSDISRDLTSILGTMSKEQQIATISNLGFTKQAREGTLALLGNADAIAEYEEKLQGAGGTAEEVANNQLNTISAQFEILKSRIADVGIEIGSVLVPVLLDLIDRVEPIVNDLGPRLAGFFQTIAPIIATAIAAISQAAQSLGTFFQETLVPGLKSFLTEAERLAPVIAVGVASITAAVVSTKALDIAIAGLIVKDKILIGVQAALNAVMSANPIGLVVLAIGALATAITYVATQTTFFQDIFAKLSAFFTEAYNNVLKPVVDGFRQRFEIFMEIVKPIIEGIGAVWGALGEGMVLIYQELIEPMIGFFGELIKALFEAFVKPIFERIGQAFEILAGVFDTVYNTAIKPRFEAFFALIKFLYENVVRPILGFVIDSFAEMTQKVGDFMTNFAGNIRNAFRSLVGFIKAPINTIFGFLNRLIDGINSISFTIPSPGFGIPPFTFGGVNLPKLPQLADGGIVMPRPGGVLANIAEAGQPEAVIPLDRAGGFGKGDTYNITVNAGVGTDPVSVGRAVVDAIKRYESTSGKVFASA